MGVLNVTPDSFADRSHFVSTLDGRSELDVARAVDAARAMEAAGADLIDIGGESTRPDAQPVTVEDECARVLPVVEAVATNIQVPLSIDTYKSAVARRAIAAGATIVNDISGLRYDPALADVVAETGAAMVLMHMRGRPASMYEEAVYEDLISEVAEELSESIDRATRAGVSMDRLILDPGVGFAKRAEHSYGVLAQLPELASRLDRPFLIGVSRKSFLRTGVGDRPAPDRDWGTAAAVTAAVLGGAHIIRVHAVGEMAQVIRVAEAIRQAGLEERGPTTHTRA
jgi:dihydropteroate synthase